MNVANTDNRLLCNAVRMVLEPVVSPRILDIQRGFLGGRSMLANLVDIEEGMLYAAPSSDNAAAIFFDFAAAFPSIEHGCMRRVFEKLRWPPSLLRFIDFLYSANRCKLALGL